MDVSTFGVASFVLPRRWKWLLVRLRKFVTRVMLAALHYAAISMQPTLRDIVVNAYLPHSSSSRGWKHGDPKEAPGDETPPGLSLSSAIGGVLEATRRHESESSAASSSQLPRDSLASQSHRRRTRRRAAMQGTKMWCHVLLHEHFLKFGLVELLNCEEGLPTKWGNHIIRVRGKGSGQCYYGASEEAIPLMVSVVSHAFGAGEVSEASPGHFLKAVEVTIAKVNEIWEHFARTHNERPWQFGGMSSGAEKVLAVLIHDDLSAQCRLLQLPPPLMPIGEQDASMAAAATTAGF
jgi:hypothetical protein